LEDSRGNPQRKLSEETITGSHQSESSEEVII